MVLVIGLYLLNFGILLGYGVSAEVGAWGQFGDFVGGLLNPILAFLAFYWLTQSTLIQKQELSLSVKALTEAAEAQSEQARLHARAAQLNALSVLVRNAQNQIDAVRSEVVYIQDQFTDGANPIKNRNGTVVERRNVGSYIADMQNEIVKFEVERLEYVIKIQGLVA